MNMGFEECALHKKKAVTYIQTAIVVFGSVFVFLLMTFPFDRIQRLKCKITFNSLNTIN